MPSKRLNNGDRNLRRVLTNLLRSRPNVSVWKCHDWTECLSDIAEHAGGRSTTEKKESVAPIPYCGHMEE